MRITLLAVGRSELAWVRESLGLYCSRIAHYAPFFLKELPDIKGTASLSEAQVKLREGEGILKSLKPSDRLILLDERGKSFRSVGFASYLQGLFNGGGGDLVFCIGGPYGFSPEVYARATDRISLSTMTFSHQMVRTIFAEQLYRAFTIIKGEPYHHE